MKLSWAALRAPWVHMQGVVGDGDAVFIVEPTQRGRWAHAAATQRARGLHHGLLGSLLPLARACERPCIGVELVLGYFRAIRRGYGPAGTNPGNVAAQG